MFGERRKCLGVSLSIHRIGIERFADPIPWIGMSLIPELGGGFEGTR
jgi:hypothetical protein